MMASPIRTATLLLLVITLYWNRKLLYWSWNVLWDDPHYLLTRPTGHQHSFVRNAKHSDLQNRWVNKHDFTLLLNEKHICEDNVLLLIAVLSAPVNKEVRQTIRNTYGSVKDASMRVIFFLGADANDRINSLDPILQQESNTYHDIIKGDFNDHYDNLTYKTVLGLYWVNNYCRKAKYIVKIDDDSILNVYKLIYFLHELDKSGRNKSNVMYCKTVAYAVPDRAKSSKFYTSYMEYPYAFFPLYCSGPGYLFSNDVAMALYQASKYVPFYKHEDVFMGFCAEIAGTPLTDSIFGFYIHTTKEWYYWPMDWDILRHLDIDSKQWYRIWNNSLSSSVQHTLNYYRILKVCLIIAILSVICILFIVVRSLCSKYQDFCIRSSSSKFVVKDR